MRPPNFKIGWLVPSEVIALTHFHSDIIPEDIQGALREAQELVREVTNTFHMIIDNRVVPMNHVYSLQQLQQASPLLQHSLLEYLVVVKPENAVLTEEQCRMEERNGVTLKNCNSVDEGVRFLSAMCGYVLADINLGFFPHSKTLRK